MMECKQPGCRCFTQSGYYIKYENDNVESVLFVCDDCYNEKFSSKCFVGDFDEDRYIVKDNIQRYKTVNPTIRNLIRYTRKAAKTARVSMILATLILVAAFGLKERHSIRTELRIPKLHVQINTDIHEFEGISSRLKVILEQVNNVFTYGGIEND